MKMFPRLSAWALGLALLALVAPQTPLVTPANAAFVSVCAPSRVDSAAGPRQVVVPGSQTASAYTLNARGCALVGFADLGYLSSLGYIAEGGFAAIRVQNVTTTPVSLTLPAGTVINRIVAEETSGGTVSGILKVGTQAGGSQICCVSGFSASFTASSPTIATDGNIKIFSPSSTAATSLFFDTTGAITTGRLNFTVHFAYY